MMASKEALLARYGPKKKRRKVAMEDGHSAGLRDAQDYRKDEDKLREETRQKFKNMDQQMSGEGAETVYRDKHGRRLEMLEQFKRQQDGAVADPAETKYKWGKETPDQTAKAEFDKRVEEEKTAPFARSANDPKLNTLLKQRSRWGDPLEEMRRRMGQGSEASAAAEARAMPPPPAPSAAPTKRASRKKAYPPYRGPEPPPNRFNIQPGHRWDGVDRSTGFEKQHYQNQTRQKIRQEEEYKWSVSDM